MDSIGIMKILIEGDATGLTSQLKKAGSTITNFVSQMNKQEVNWTQILSRTISPAVISGIAATFALAIVSALQFQNAMTQAANNSSTAFTDHLGQASAAAIDISSKTGQSASNVAEALGIATKALGSYAAGQALVSEASQFSLATGIPLLDLIKELTPVMQQWGITDAGQITQTITNLFGIAEQGRASIQDLTSVLADTGPMLKGKTSIEEAGSAFQAFASQAGNTVPAAIQVFQKVAQAAFGDIHAQADLVTLGVSNIKKAVQDGGMTEALTNLEKSFTKLSDSTKIILGNRAGFDDKTVGNLAEASKSNASFAESSKQIAENAPRIGEGISKNVSAVGELTKAWRSLQNDLMGSVGGFLVSTLTDLLTGLDSAVKGATGSGTFKATDFLGDLSKNLFNVLSLGTAKATNFGGLYSNGGDQKGNTPNQTNSTHTNVYNYNNYISSNYDSANSNALSPNLNYMSTFGYGK